MIEKTHQNQSDTNIDLLNLVAQTGEASYATLATAFVDPQAFERNEHARLSKRLEYLVSKDYLTSSGRGRARVFKLGDAATQRPASAASVARGLKDAATSRPWSCTWAQSGADEPAPHSADRPPRLTVTALPTRSPAMRPGALDFMGKPSRGFAC